MLQVIIRYGIVPEVFLWLQPRSYHGSMVGKTHARAIDASYIVLSKNPDSTSHLRLLVQLFIRPVDLNE